MEEEYEHRRSIYKQENENIRKSINRRSTLRQSQINGKNMKNQGNDGPTPLRDEQAFSVNTGPVNEFSVDNQKNGHANRNTQQNNDYETRAGNETYAKNTEMVEMTMLNSGINQESRFLLNNNQADDGLSVPVSPKVQDPVV